ncbi:MAG: hypothetical protein KatS3mg131_3872 [Candidatus Tectimicrobiota bacterium]|nr:MAG: hypothetical protein KatS3mg131_3872 [Candidatus Tectomicrobia bacterium]
MKLLVVDDNPAQRRALAESLRSRGFEVVTASSGEEALARLRQEGVDLVVADVFMPRLDGLQLCHAVKADPQLSRIPCVLLLCPLHRCRGRGPGAPGRGGGVCRPAGG